MMMREVFNFGTDFYGIEHLHVIHDKIIGKIQIVKTFLLSQIIYVMQAIKLPDEVLKEINTIIHKFLWKKKYNNKRAFEKVRRDVICQDYNKGGLKMINVGDMLMSFLIKWVKELFKTPQSNHCLIPMYYFGKLGDDLSVFHSNTSAKHFKGF